jgi:hypothetical protein
MSWDSNAPIRFKLGTIALYNLLTQRRAIDAQSPTLGLLKAGFERLAEVHAYSVRNEFLDMTTRPLPTNLERRRQGIQ